MADDIYMYTYLIKVSTETNVANYISLSCFRNIYQLNNKARLNCNLITSKYYIYWRYIYI